MFPEPMKPTLYPIPALAAGSVRRLFDVGGVAPASTAWGADALREEGLGVEMACGTTLGEAAVAGADIDKKRERGNARAESTVSAFAECNNRRTRVCGALGGRRCVCVGQRDSEKCYFGCCR